MTISRTELIIGYSYMSGVRIIQEIVKIKKYSEEEHQKMINNFAEAMECANNKLKELLE